jgi:hypothetical protein
VTRELLVVLWCDASHEVSEPATRAVIVTTEGSKPRRIDLCEQDYARLVDPLVPLLDEYGADPESAPARGNSRAAATSRASSNGSTKQVGPDPGPCPLCDGTYRWLSTHLTGAHGVTGESTAVEGGYACPACGEVSEHVRGLAMHAQPAHGKRLNVLIGEATAAAVATNQARRRARARHPAGKAKG